MDHRDKSTARELETIREEIRTLKQHNRRMRTMVGAMCVCVVGFFSIAASKLPDRITWSSYLNLKSEPMSLKKQVGTQPVGDVIQVSEIQILNAEGGQVGFIGSDSAGDGLIILGDISGRAQAAMSVDADGAGLFTAFNSGGGQAVIVGTDEFGDGFVGVGNIAGGLASTMGVGASGGGLFGASNAAGTGGTSLGIDSLNVGRLTISNEAGTDEIIEIGAKGGNGQIDVRTSGGVKIWASDDVPVISSNPGEPSGLLGDLDNDGDVDFGDFLVFASNFGRSLSG